MFIFFEHRSHQRPWGQGSKKKTTKNSINENTFPMADPFPNTQLCFFTSTLLRLDLKLTRLHKIGEKRKIERR